MKCIVFNSIFPAILIFLKYCVLSQDHRWFFVLYVLYVYEYYVYSYAFVLFTCFYVYIFFIILKTKLCSTPYRSRSYLLILALLLYIFLIVQKL